MPSTLREVLEELRASALDQRDKGDKFERLMRSYLRTDPEWANRFSDVWLWSEWPGRGGRPDTGIDLVARFRDSEGLAAIQCKFYEPDRVVAKQDLDSFIAVSGKRDFTARYVIDTAKAWSKNADDVVQRQDPVVQRVDIGYLESAHIDWSQYSWSTPEVVTTTGPKHLRPHQRAAVDDVRRGLAAADRGKLIMACGTGKTFTSLKLAEEMVGAGGQVLFLVPSIQLLSQSLREWMAEAAVDIRPFAVCSDVRVGRRATDEGDLSTVDLTEPATTDAATLATRMTVGRYAKERMTVVFATYQSIDVVAKAQQHGVGDFDLIIGDEAHRTTGVTLASDADESHFVKVHNNDVLRARKRLYMTATPRVFGEDVKRKAKDADAVLADMNDEALYGAELHRLGFGDAVEADLLTDYKVLVLAVDEAYVAENFQQAMASSGEINLNDAAKLIGCWNGLAKNFGTGNFGSAESEGDHREPMKRAVAFAMNIKASKLAAASFPVMVDRALQDQASTANPTRVQAAHVDGTMGVQERNRHLAWLSAEPPAGVCRILSNARCLSEGVDVPALDAVMFLTPRGSQVDIVQSVGRVMRKAPGKKLGYIILPIVVPSGVAPEEALRDNERYRVVWQVLQALRSHDDRFHAMVNQLELNKKKDSTVIIDRVPPPDVDGVDLDRRRESEQATFEFDFDGFRDAMYARIVQKVGERRYWETWAKDVADIAQAHITRIKGLLADPESAPAMEFAEFLKGLRGNLNEQITADEAIEMLAQHLITRPIFEALFDEYDFAAHNPVAQIMELMLAALDEHNLGSEQAKLDRFYDSVRRRVEGVQNAEGKQRVIVELYDKFFATAFKKTVDRLGIVYTPVEIVDFILHSADEVLRQEFGQGLTDEGVHILDGFTGTGTFMVRLLQSGLIKPHDLARKYAHELHANEILLLAYYIAAVNIETTYAALWPSLVEEGDEGARLETKPTYEPFPGLVLTDTFQSYEDGDRDDQLIFVENNERIEAQRRLPITVIVGNPPWSVGQDSANDDNANLSYPGIDAAIRESYAARSTALLLRNLYDSYVRAIKWATLRIGDRGVVAFVTNGGFLDANTADGLRKSLAEEFATIHVLNLRGNQRTAGEQSRKEGGKVFGGGSRATVAVTVLVRKPGHHGPARVLYTDIGDYLTREEKLSKVAKSESVEGLESLTVTPNRFGDWLSQRSTAFDKFTALKGRGAIFELTTLGVSTSRDAWVHSFSKLRALENSARTVQVYESTRQLKTPPTNDPREISWSRGLRDWLQSDRVIELDMAATAVSAYRPFTQQWLYHGPGVLERPGPTVALCQRPNVVLYAVGMSSAVPFGALVTSTAPNLHLTGAGSGGSAWPRWRYELVDRQALDFGGDTAEVVDGYRRVDNITDEALARWRAAYPDWDVSKDDIFFYVYGLLHSPDYRETYAADLKKMLPRIPLVATTADAQAFAEAGRRLSELHLGYESVAPYPLDGLDAGHDLSGDAAYEFYSVGDKKMRFGAPTAEAKAAGGRHDRTVIRYNDRITLSGIPTDAYRYQLGSRSAIEWIIDRYYIKTDKPSGIVNNPNDWSREVGDPRYILDLLARIVTVSLETMQIVDALPALTIREQQG